MGKTKFTGRWIDDTSLGVRRVIGLALLLYEPITQPFRASLPVAGKRLRVKGCSLHRRALHSGIG